MAVGRNRCVIRGIRPKKVMPHDELMERIKKSLYYGRCGNDVDSSLCDVPVSRPLAEYASELFSEPHKGHSLNRLNRVTAGSVHASPCSLIMALIYLDRLNSADPSYVRRIMPSELFIVSMMVSTKFYCGHDEEIYLSDWAKEGNITEDRIRQLEIEFLCAIDWNIYISSDQFFNKLKSVEKTLAQREGIRRGWLTYTELLNLLPSFTIAKFFLNNIAILAVSYAASVMTIAGAFFLVSHIPGNALTKQSTTSSAPTDTEIATTITTQPSTIDNSNCSTSIICPAFDIEEELRKLEIQYNETSLDKKKNNENAGPLINFNDYNHNIDISAKIGIESGVNLQNFMDDDCDGHKNCSRLTFWNLMLTVSEQHSLSKLSYIWLKFI